ncbi:hypothetical protein D9M68_428630 [compost metagenome]
MVVVLARTEEARARIACHQPEPQHVAEERVGFGDVGDLQMDMADGGSISHAVPIVLGCFVIERLEIERQRVHADGAVGLEAPFGARPVTIDLDTVTFGIGEVDCFADQMVGSAL